MIMNLNDISKTFLSFSSVLPTFRVGYHGSKPIESENEHLDNNYLLTWHWIIMCD